MRLFVAIALPDEVRAALRTAQQDLRAAGASVRWVRPEGVHLTLRFLGDTDEERHRRVVDALGGVRGAPFEAAVRGIGFFPNSRRPRVVWAGLEEPSGSLSGLQADVERAVVAAGFEPEGRGEFRPHLTLGRLRYPQRPGRLAQVAGGMERQEHGAFRADAFHLYMSELRPEGARYTVLETFPLGGDA